MHSRIIQIEAHPVEEDYRTTASDYWDDHWFTNSVADYTADDENRAETLEEFRDVLRTAQEFITFIADDEGEGFILREGFHTAYFHAEYVAFDACLKDLVEKANADAFVTDGFDMQMSTLKNAYDDEFGLYIQSDDTGLVTLNRFLRYAKTDIRYYVGGTVDYHW